MKKEKLTKFSDIIYYYKWHMIIAVVMIIAVAYFAVECHNKVKDDLVITAVLSNYSMSTASEEIGNDMASNGVIPDLNGDGVSKAYVHVITFPVKPQNQEEMMAGQQVSIAFAADDSILFLIDEDLLEMYEDDMVFGDISRVAELQGVSEENLYIAEDGTVMGISLKGNEYLESKGIPTQTLYACYRYISPESITDEIQTKINAADGILAHIMK
ncbi:MAG: hypothetical protein IKB50_00440 [Clostridia bacterium]|nr:hypothetical protein [Clostridia bacterium]